jgi:hypothetical protein
MAESVEKLIAAVRSQTDRINDDSVTDDEICSYLSDGGRALVDIFNESAPHWLQASLTFTLTGNTFDTSVVDLPDDFELDLGLDWLDAPGTNGPVTIRRLPTFNERNSLLNTNPLLPGNNIWARNYEAQGDELRVYAPQSQTGGTYRLWYVRRFTELALPVTTEFSVTSNFTPLDNSGLLRFAFGSNPGDHPEFSDAMIGGSLTIDLASPNDSFNVSGAGITGPDPLENSIDVSEPYPGGSPTLPATGTASIVYQPEDTVATLPNVWTQFRLFILTHACISVRIKFEEQIGELEQRLQQEANRARRMAEKRDSALAAIPILGGRGYDSPNFDSGNFFDDGWDW